MDSKAARLRVCAGFAVAAAAAVAGWFGWFERLELLVYDSQLQFFGRKPSDRVVIVAIDEQSLAALGQWAWPRSVHADLVRRLTDAGARSIAFDVAFVDPTPRNPDGEALLAKAIGEHGRVVLPILHQQLPYGGQTVEALPSLPLIQAAAALAHVDVEHDLDGVVRRTFLKAGIATPHWPALALAAVELYTGKPLATIPAVRAEQRSTVSPMGWIRDGIILIPYAGPPGHFSRISYVDVLNRNVDHDRLRDRLVLVGATATALGDGLIVPFARPNRAMSGVELQANLVDALLQEIFWRPLEPRLVALFGCAIILAAVALYEVIRATWLVILGALIAVTLATSAALAVFGLWIPPVAMSVGLILSFAIHTALRYGAARKVLVREQDRARASLKSVADGVVATDASGTVTFMNPAAEELTGFTAAEIRGLHINQVLRLYDPLSGAPIALDLPASACGSPAKTTWEAVLTSRTGKTRDVRGTIATFGETASRVRGAVVAVNDVTDVRQLARSIEYQATHDPLTNLANRKLFEQALDHAILGAATTHSSLALLVVDVAEVATINAALGREAANAILRTASERIANSVQEPDMVARLGEDRFGLFFPGLAHEDSAKYFAHKVKRALVRPFDVGGLHQVVGASIGVSFFPRDARDSRSLIMAAERAVMRAKQTGGDRIHYADQEGSPSDWKRARIAQTLRHALHGNEMELHFQPQVTANAGCMAGVEALLRWSAPDGRRYPPPDVIAVAEELGLTSEISAWTLKTAYEQAQTWELGDLQPLRVSVNLAPMQFLDPKLPAMIDGLLSGEAARGIRLALEITEESLILDVDAARRIMEQIRDMDVDLFVDDFGVGYASLVYLKKLPLSGLKIDRSYVQDALLDPGDAAIVRAIIVLAHSMGLQVVAEGVETKGQLDFLRCENCDEVQGYLISRPLPTQQLVSWLKSRSSITAT